ncbi:MAG TPA: 23S rRNA (pseudouridine(1915)-N(3))-methyltransferase RlmH [Acidobacteriota bacterium]|nr:23S rRNA (pseudouridine(1915)-N(3))-methyltransferase RlmH [Acidobacteriota bacterium]
MRLEFLWIGKTKDASLARLEKRYLDRIRRFYPASASAVSEQSRKDVHQKDAAERREAELVLKKLPAQARLVVLDERGAQVTSRGLAGWFKKWTLSALPQVVFVVGGHAGVPQEVLRRADKVLSLGRMTLPHELARVVLLEQIYRAATIVRGLPYHNE